MVDLASFAAFALPFLPELVVVAAALVVLALDVARVRRLELFGGIATAALGVAIVLVLADLGIGFLHLFATVPSASIDPGPAAAATSLYTFTSLGFVFQAIFLLAAFLVSLASMSRPSRESGAGVFYALVLLATLGMLLVALASDLIFLLLAIEVTSIATYLLVGYTRRDDRALEAAMKFYVVGALSTVLSFFGASLLFEAFGTTNLYAIENLASTTAYPTLALVGYGLLIAGLAFKVTLVPFHAWAVDVYDGAPSDVSAFLAGGSKKIGLFAFFLVFLGPVLFVGGTLNIFNGSGTTVLDTGPLFQIVLGGLAVVTMTVGNVLALMQKEMKRMLAYSSISQAGYMLIGITIGTAPAIEGATLQILAHALMKTGAFLVVAAAAGLGIGPLITDWRGFGLRRPGLGIAFALMLLSLAGVPLTLGFVSKFVLFSAAVQAQGYFVWLAVAGLLNSALSVFYYARVLRVMYFDGSPSPPPVPSASSLGLPLGGLGYGRAAAIALVTVAIVAAGIYPEAVLGPVQHAAVLFHLDHLV